MAATFDYNRFITLQELELAHYIEPLLLEPSLSVSSEALKRMLHDIPNYDEYHLVYALRLGVDHSPDTFVPFVPQYLDDKHLSVFCTALNILDRLPGEYITQSLVDSVRAVLLSPPRKDLVAGILEKMESRSG